MIIIALSLAFVIVVVALVNARNALKAMVKDYEDAIAQNRRLCNSLRLKGIEIDKLERENAKLKKK